LIIGGDEYLSLYGGEAVIWKGNVISRLRSAGYGHTVKKNIGYAYLPLDLAMEKACFKVEIFGELVSAEVAPDVLLDSDGKALKRRCLV
jgi:glycine cleavage system aminomethyltransferase T